MYGMNTQTPNIDSKIICMGKEATYVQKQTSLHTWMYYTFRRKKARQVYHASQLINQPKFSIEF